jgi:hypothetical protein
LTEAEWQALDLKYDRKIVGPALGPDAP